MTRSRKIDQIVSFLLLFLLYISSIEAIEPDPVYYPLRFLHSENDEFLKYLGERVKLSCHVFDSRYSTLEWTRNGEVITEAEYSSKRVRKPHPFVLEISDLEVRDHGIWACNVTNPHGSITRNFTIEIADLCAYYEGGNFSSYPLECVCVWFYTKRPPGKPIDYMAIEAKPDECQPYSKRVRKAQQEYQNERLRLTSSPPPPHFPSHPPSSIGLPLPTPSQKIDDFLAWNESSLNATVQIIKVAELSSEELIEESPRIETTPKPRKKVTTVKPKETTTPAEPPHFVVTEHLPLITLPAGRTIKLNCKANGTNLHYVWHKNEAVIVQGSPRATGYIYGLRNHSLELEDSVPSDSGLYKCLIQNNLGSIEREFVVKVVERLRSAPVILPNVLRNQTVNVNGSATFTCEVISDLTPHIVWVKMEKTDGEYFYLNQTVGEVMFAYVLMDNYPKAYITNTANSSTLRLVNATSEDQGIYACITGNSLGKAMANASLIVNEFRTLTLPTGKAQSQGVPLSILILSLIFIFLLFLLCMLLLTYYLCMKINRKKMEEATKLLPRRKKVVVRQKDHGGTRTGWSDLPSTYQIQIIDQNPHQRAAGGGTRQSHISSDLTINCEYEIEEDPGWEIDRSRIKLVDQLGEGAFGEVWRAILTVKKEDYPEGAIDPVPFDQPVAVKRLKSTAHERELRDLVLEMTILKTLDEMDYTRGKENVLRLLGCCTGVGPLLVVLELCPHGNLRDFLRAHRPREDSEPTSPHSTAFPGDYLEPRKPRERILIDPLTQRHLVDFAYQVSNGMLFLSSKQIIHRDLAARNVLVAEDFAMKISDFGLSRNTSSSKDYYRKRGNGRLPIKWMAPEALEEHMYTTESDVWSFGILLWEIMTLGGTPYPTIQMHHLYDRLKEGYRMESPHNCPQEIYNVMLGCWQDVRERRPSFSTICDYLQWMLEESDRAAAAMNEIESQASDSSQTDLDNLAPAPPREIDGSTIPRRKARPLSAPVVLPTEGIPHSICDDDDDERRDDDEDDDEDEGPLIVNGQPVEGIPLLPTSKSSSSSTSTPKKKISSSSSSSSNGDHPGRRVPPPLPTRESQQNEMMTFSPLHRPPIHSMTADSALGSPSWISSNHNSHFPLSLSDSEYAIPIIGMVEGSF
ncbi:unnamed protein product, partial [Mesorhabditis belari]|uniref:receptor protein-tyrosine kinase n=1 Tax=Mesorhabditis belari TaxID=2138241 RepID=A0AAF3J4G3_9BILA